MVMPSGVPISIAAEEHIGEQAYPIRLTDTALTPDDLSRVLQQAGGYILCALNRDATSDRGISSYDSLRQFALTQLDTERYRWEQSRVDVLLQ